MNWLWLWVSSEDKAWLCLLSFLALQRKNEWKIYAGSWWLGDRPLFGSCFITSIYSYSEIPPPTLGLSGRYKLVRFVVNLRKLCYLCCFLLLSSLPLWEPTSGSACKNGFYPSMVANLSAQRWFLHSNRVRKQWHLAFCWKPARKSSVSSMTRTCNALIFRWLVFKGETIVGGTNWIDVDTTVYNKSLVYTYNFAYPGAVVDAKLVTPYISTVQTLTDQVNDFLTNFGEKPATTPWTSQNALFSIWIGVNDIWNTYNHTGDRSA